MDDICPKCGRVYPWPLNPFQCVCKGVLLLLKYIGLVFIGFVIGYTTGVI